MRTEFNGPLGQFDVSAQRIVAVVEQALEHCPAGQGGERRGTDELSGRGGHDDRHAGAALHQLAHQRGGFIGRDAATDADD